MKDVKIFHIWRSSYTCDVDGQSYKAAAWVKDGVLCFGSPGMKHSGYSKDQLAEICELVRQKFFDDVDASDTAIWW